jgi:hypothetical protein
MAFGGKYKSMSLIIMPSLTETDTKCGIKCPQNITGSRLSSKRPAEQVVLIHLARQACIVEQIRAPI